MRLQNKPYKGTTDWFPEEFKIRKYIFDTWREVCTRYGYEEYLSPLVEPIELFQAKSGEDLGGKELMTVIDRAGRKVAIRPEMTPSVTRMVSQIYEGTPKPIRYFSVANFMRAEKPQRGRNREFWQLNYDIFGESSLNADLEVLQIALDIMISFDPPPGAFTLFLNHRVLIDDLIRTIGETEKDLVEIIRIMDKWEKEPRNELIERLSGAGVSDKGLTRIERFMEITDASMLLQNFPELKESRGLKDVLSLTERLEKLGYGEWIRFQPNVIRGFDYYDGMVFEVFDNDPNNLRALFGGGRYNGLASIFGSNDIPAVGCAPGDETLKLFLESWDLLKGARESDRERYYIPILGDEYSLAAQKLASELRSKGNIVELGLETSKVGKSLEYANKKGTRFVILIGEDELSMGRYTLKDLSSGEQTQVDL